MMVSAKFDLKKNIDKLGDQMDSAAKKVGNTAKDVGNTVKDVTISIKDSLNKNVFQKLKKVLEDLKKALKNVTSTNPEIAKKQKDKIMEDAKSQIKSEIKKEIKNTFYDVILKKIFGVSMTEAELRKAIDDSDLPQFVKEWIDELEDAEVEFDNWNLPKEIDQKLNEIYAEHPEFEKYLDEEIERIVLTVADGMPSDKEIQKFVNNVVDTFEKDILSDKKIEEFIQGLKNEANGTRDIFKDDIEQFDIDQFREDVKKTVNLMKDEYEKISADEKMDLIDFVLATNEKLDNLLSQITDPASRERLIKRLRSEIGSELKDNNRDYDDIMNTVDEKVVSIEEEQLARIQDASITLKTPYTLLPKQQYTFSLEDLMVNQRSDIDFFEFMSVESNFQNIKENSAQEESYIYVTPTTIRGIAPNAEMTYVFNVELKYTSYRDTSGKPYIVETTLTMEVSQNTFANMLTPKNDVQRYLLMLCCILGLTSAILIMYQCYSKYKESKIIRYEDVDDESGPQHHIEYPRTSDIQIG